MSHHHTPHLLATRILIQGLRLLEIAEELKIMDPTLDVSDIVQLATDLGTISKEVGALQAQGSGTDPTAIAAAKESQLAADQIAMNNALAPAKATVQELLDMLTAPAPQPQPVPSVAPSTLSVSAEPLSTASAAPDPLSNVDQPGPTDPNASPDPQATSLNVSPLSITGSVGSPLSVPFTVDGGVAPYSFTGFPPGGLSLSSTGTLSGTPSMAISDSFTMTVKDSSSEPINQSVSVSVSIQ